MNYHFNLLNVLNLNILLINCFQNLKFLYRINYAPIRCCIYLGNYYRTSCKTRIFSLVKWRMWKFMYLRTSQLTQRLTLLVICRKNYSHRGDDVQLELLFDDHLPTELKYSTIDGEDIDASIHIPSWGFDTK